MEASNGKPSPDWRFTAKGFLDKLKYILVHNIMADLTIQLINNGNINKEFHVHSFLFMIGSEVFEKMLNSPFKEGVTRVIEIKDVDPEIFEILINYFYGQSVDLKNVKNLKQVQDLANLADYYMIHGLKDEIAKYLESLDTSQAACLGLMISEKCNAPKLKDVKLEYIVSHTKEVLEQEEFLSLPEEAISWILEQDFLKIKEFDLFKAVEAWVKLNVDKYGKQIIDSLISKVRYLSMTKEEFASGPARSNLIKPEDLVALLTNLILKDCMPFPSGFSRLKRNEIELNFERRDSKGGSWTLSNIKVNKAVTIEGFHIFTLNGNPIESYDEDIVIRVGIGTDFENLPIVGRFKGKTHYSSSVFVQLDKNLEMSKENLYSVSVTSSGGISKINILNKPLNVGDTTHPFTFHKHPNCTFVSDIVSIKLATF